VTYLDGTALLKAGKARRQVLSYRVGRVLQPQGEDEMPFDVNSRATTADFFPMFDVPFKFGSGWDKSADNTLEQVSVLSREMNDRGFGGENSVGRTVILNGDAFAVSGVLDDWAPIPKYYDVTTGAFGDPSDVYFPFSVSISKELYGRGNTSCWKPTGEGGYSAILNSECVWMQFWAELHGEEEKAEYLAFLDAYVESQKILGRFPRPLDNRLDNVMDWMENQEVVAKDVNVLLGLAVLFLVVCLLNTIGLLLAKVLRRSGDIGLRRALGASKKAVFMQYIVEAGLIGLAGGVLGVGMTWLGLRGIEILYSEWNFISNVVTMDWVMILTAVLLAILSALGAALYPTWRACRIHPASQLKTI
jgi:putative ABC transport system permease protein